jgi:hypothetical protein
MRVIIISYRNMEQYLLDFVIFVVSCYLSNIPVIYLIAVIHFINCVIKIRLVVYLVIINQMIQYIIIIYMKIIMKK